MTFRNRVLAAIAAGMLLTSGSVFGATNATEIRLALTSLRVALAKIGVANAVLSNPQPPSSNAEAHLAAPNKMTSNEISGIIIGKGGVINIYLTPATGAPNGILQLVPSIVTDKQGKRGVKYACSSPNIPDIATAAPGCRYAPSR